MNCQQHTFSLDTYIPGQDHADQRHKHHTDSNRSAAGIEVLGRAMAACHRAVLAQHYGVSCDEGQEDGILELCHAG